MVLLVMSMLSACGSKKEQEQEAGADAQTPNIITNEEDVSGHAQDSGTDDDVIQENEDPGTDEEEAAVTGTPNARDITGDYTLLFYEYGHYLETMSLSVTENEFQLIDPDNEAMNQTYSYTVLADYLLGLYEDGAYTICYYKISGMEMTLNMLGVTSENLVGTYPVFYTDQQSTATIDFHLDGTALEDHQVDVYGQDRTNPYAFKYCWYADSEDSLMLLVCLDNGYFAYSVAFAEDGETLNLTDVGGYTYDLE